MSTRTFQSLPQAPQVAGRAVALPSIMMSLTAIAIVSCLALGAAALTNDIRASTPVGTAARAKQRFSRVAIDVGTAAQATRGTSQRAKVRHENPAVGSAAEAAKAPVAGPKFSGRAASRNN